jgi:hypothetical protein
MLGGNKRPKGFCQTVHYSKGDSGDHDGKPPHHFFFQTKLNSTLELNSY